jgi:hypothetical protein
LLSDQISDEYKDFWDDYCLWNKENITEEKRRNQLGFKYTMYILV